MVVRVVYGKPDIVRTGCKRTTRISRACLSRETIPERKLATPEKLQINQLELLKQVGIRQLGIRLENELRKCVATEELFGIKRIVGTTRGDREGSREQKDENAPLYRKHKHMAWDEGWEESSLQNISNDARRVGLVTDMHGL